MTVLLIVTLVSMILALVMSIVAWSVARDERERSDARVAALAEDIYNAAVPVAQAAGRRAEPARLRAVAPAAARTADLFSAQPASSSRSTIVIGVGLLMLATAAALIVVLGANRRGDRSLAAPRHAAAAPSRAAAATALRTPDGAGTPLELVALGHDRDGDRLMVRGLIRNPAAGARVEGLTAVVFMFDRDGGFLGSGRGTIDAAALAPGGDSTFLVGVPGASGVARYRVSFRTETGIVAHVDKRTKP